MPPGQLDTPLMREQGIGRFRQPQQPIPPYINSSPSHLALDASTNAGDLWTGVQQADQQQMSHQLRQKLPPLLLDASARQHMQVLRRRVSFSKASNRQVQSLRSPRSDSLDKHARQALTNLLRAQDDTKELGTCSGSSLLSFDKQCSGKPRPKRSPNMPLAVAMNRVDLDNPVDLAQSSQYQAHLLPQHSMHGDSKRPETKPTKKVKRSKKSLVHDGLRQTIAQINACTLQLHQLQSEQQSMQQVLQILKFHSEAILHKFESAAVQQQLG